MQTAFLPWCISCLGYRTFSYPSKEGLFPKMTSAEKKWLALLLGGKNRFLSKVCDAQHGLAMTRLPCHLSLVVTTYFLVLSIPATLAFVPSPAHLCNLPPHGPCPQHLLCLECSSHLSPHLPPASVQLVVAQELILCFPQMDQILLSVLLCTVHLSSAAPTWCQFHIGGGAFDSCPFQPKESVRSMRAGTGSFMLTASIPGPVAGPGLQQELKKYL